MNTQPFGMQLLSLPTIFDDHFFIIPDYQRGYAWEKDQVNDLLKDVDHLMNDGMALRHYTGTLVLSQPEGAINGEFHIVDGQQRLTTLVILIKALSEHLSGDIRATVESRYVRRGGLGNERYVLRLNSDARLFHERVVLGNSNTTNEPAILEAHERLLDARWIAEKWLAEKIASGKAPEVILDTLETELGFLIYTPKEDAETGIMFEVINNRGKQLSELEKVKNYLIYCCAKLGAKELRGTINVDWSGVLRNLNDANKTSSSDEGAFLRYCVAVHFKMNKTDSQYGYDELKKSLAIDSAMNDNAAREVAIKRIDEFVRFLKTAALWYARLYGRKHEGLGASLVPVLDQIRAQQLHASIMPLFLALVIKLHGESENLVRLLKLVEILNFRVYMARRMTARNDTGQGDLYYYASRYYHNELLNDYGADQRRIGKQLVETEENALEHKLVGFIIWYAPDERFKSSFALETGSPDDFYDWGGLRYFLMNYEVKLQPNKTIQIDKILRSRQQGKSADYLSLEHLWAREHRNGDGENNREIDKFQKRRLGNFVLLELRINIQGSDQGLEQKLPIYLGRTEATDLAHVRKMEKDAKKLLKECESQYRKKNYYLKLHEQLNDLQEQRYVLFAEDRWSVKDFLGYRQYLREAVDAEE